MAPERIGPKSEVPIPVWYEVYSQNLSRVYRFRPQRTETRPNLVFQLRRVIERVGEGERDISDICKERKTGRLWYLGRSRTI
jgi:hypothetical protein